MSLSTDVLKVRVDMVESLLFGNKQKSNELVKSSLNRIEDKLVAMEKEIPASKSCSDLILKLHPLINEKKLQLNQINDKVESLLVRKDELQNLIKDLDSLKQHSGVLDTSFCNGIDIDECNNKLVQLDRGLQPLIEESRIQSKELDTLLEAYEKAVSISLLPVY